MHKNIQKIKKYLFVLPWDLSHAGGVNQVVKNLYSELVLTKDYVPVILVNQWSSFFMRKGDETDHNIFYFRLRRLYERGQSAVAGIKNPLFFPYELLVCLYFIWRNHIEVVNVHYPEIYALQFAVLKKFGLFRGKLILSFHGFDVQTLEKADVKEKKIWEVIFTHADAVVCCSKALQEKIGACSSQAVKKCHIIHNGINEAEFLHEKDASYKPPEVLSSPYILTVGTFEEKKGQDILIRAFEIVARDCPELKLILVGRTAGYYEVLKKLSVDSGVANKVHFFENIPHSCIHYFFEKAKAFVLPSFEEPFGIVILEAAIFGVPVIGSNVGGIPEILENESFGLLFSSGDHAALAEKIVELMEDKAKADFLASNLKNRVRERFTMNKACQYYLRLCGAE